MANIRIKDLSTDSALSAGDYVVVDSASEGSRKFDLGTELAALKEDLNGWSDDTKTALLNCFAHVAWTDEHGQDYYDALEEALYAEEPKTLVSISAEYTQSGTVYDTDTLDSLKADLAVTATYDDSSTAVVTAYTLSGTLTDGTSTITASYNGKTATFNVTVVGVPSGYVRHEYIECTDHGGTANKPRTAMIPTKTYANLNAISLEFKYNSKVGTTSGDCIFGGRSASGAGSSLAFYTSTNGFGFHIHGADTSVSIAQTQDAVHHVVYTNTSATPSTITFDGTDYSVTWVNSNTINTFLSLFTNQQSTSTSNVALKDYIELGCIIVRNLDGNIINYYEPVLRSSDNVIGLYDIIEDVFYTASTATYATVGNTNCIYALGDWS